MAVSRRVRIKANTSNNKPDNKHYLEWVQLQYNPTGSDEDFETAPASSAVNAFKVTESRTLDVSGSASLNATAGVPTGTISVTPSWNRTLTVEK
jgi:hypothetical protein